MRLSGGAFGSGLNKNIKSAYKWLGDEYEDGADIFVLGFSRGAFTARSLVGFIAYCGLIRHPSWDEVDHAYAHYQQRKNLKPDGTPTHVRFEQYRTALGKAEAAHPRPPIRFLGVWDTVGSLGIPQSGPRWFTRLLAWLCPSCNNRFHDLQLSDIVETARQAVAIDEQRQPFTPTLWHVAQPAPGQSIRQVWFPGVHADVGGGYLESGLSQITLRWMMDEAQTQGAIYDPAMAEQVAGVDWRAPIHDNLTTLYNVLGAVPRHIPLLAGTEPAPPYWQQPHPLALRRVAQPPINDAPYRDSTRLALGEHGRFDVYAYNYWNAPGVFVERGERYRVHAEGEWLDRDLRSSAAGGPAGPLRSFFNPLRRVPKAPWFSLIAVIGHGHNPDPGNDQIAVPTYAVGADAVFEPVEAGYLYFFANDAQGLYGNNRGRVVVTLTRVTDSPTVDDLGQKPPRSIWSTWGQWLMGLATLSIVVAVPVGIAWWLIAPPPCPLQQFATLLGSTFATLLALAGGYVWFSGRSNTGVQFVPVLRGQAD